MEKIRLLVKKIFSREIILYGIFGLLTTVVNLVTFSIFTHIGLEENLSNILAIIISVLFAYFTNSKFVFNSTAVTFKEKLKEFYRFILGRAFTMILEIGRFLFIVQYSWYSGIY